MSAGWEGGIPSRLSGPENRRAGDPGFGHVEETETLNSLAVSLLMPGHATVRYGTPISFGTNPHPDHEAIRVSTDAIMTAIQQAHGAVGSEDRLRS